MTPNLTISFLVVGASLLGTTRLSAQSGGGYRITASVIAGGGGTSTGGMFAVTGTLGQPVAGGASGGTFSVQSGFWSVVQTPGAPVLRIVRSGTNGVVVSWPALSTGWVLQQTSSLSSPQPVAWTDVTSPPAVVLGSENTVTFTSATGVRYFRLRQP